MPLFQFKPKKEAVIALPPPKPEELVSIMEAMHSGGLEKAINDSMQKQIDAAQNFDGFQQEGNFFGSEFNIRATAGRIKTAYMREPWIFATATIIAKTLASLPYKVVNTVTKQVDKTHPLNSKMRLGSSLEGPLLQNWKGLLDLVLGGNFILCFNNTYTEAFLCPVDQTRLNYDPNLRRIETLTLYDQAQGSQGVDLPYRQCVHHKYPNPYNQFYGLSMFTAASRPLLLDRYKQEFEMAFYLRGATNAGVIETDSDINKTRMARLMQTFEAVYTGRRNWWRTIFLPKGASWVNTGVSMTDMQHLEGLRENRLTLLAVLGIPPSMVGLTEDVNLATAEVQERNFWQNTVSPLAHFIAAGWNQSYLVRTIYQGQVEVVPDFDNIQAMQGAIISKGQRAKSVENYMLIDEIREQILGLKKLPAGRGQVFVVELRPAQTEDPFGGGGDETDPNAPDPDETEEEEEEEEDEEEMALAMSKRFKSQAITSQDRIEEKLNKQFAAGYQKYISELLGYAEEALKANEQVERLILTKLQPLARTYMAGCEKSMQLALERGFSASLAQSKSFSSHTKNYVDRVQKRLRFDDTDIQAIDYLREEQRGGERTTLARRAIETFVGYNKERTKEVLDIIADSQRDGMTTDAIAAIIRTTYGEKYKDQGFTIARTELLGAISQGIKWNHDILGEVFSVTKKQWYHVGDSASNPNARTRHAEFERLGEVPADFKYGGDLEYPRDPNAPASETINCRCSMVTVVPTDAVSNAAVILDRN